MDTQLEQRYKTPSTPGSFQGPDKVLQSALQAGLNVSRKQVQKRLQKEDSYTLNRAINRRYPHNRIITAGIDSLWEADLADLQLLHKNNDGYKYILLMIDTFSRYLWARPLKTKYSKEVEKAVLSILAEGRQPKSLRTDAGRDVSSRHMKEMYKEAGIHHYTTNNDKQAAIVERVVKTLKSKLYRYLLSKNSKRYIDVLQDLVKSYNNTIHRSLGRPPSRVSIKNENEVRYEQYLRKPKPDHTKKRQPFRFKKGDKVRISHTKERLDREYDNRWTGEVFIVVSRRRREGIPVYTLKDWLGEPLEGTFYNQELQKVIKNNRNSWKIDKELKRKIKNGKEWVYVSWLHWPAKFNSWEPADSIKE